MPQNAYASVSTVHLQTRGYAQGYAPPVQHPQPSPPVYSNLSYPVHPQHPVYGSFPQPYGTPFQQSPPLQPVQPYASNSTATFASSYSPKEREGILKSSWHRADRLAAKSYTNLKDTLTSGAGKSKTQITHYVDTSTGLISQQSTQVLNQGAALCDLISSKLDAVITSMDGERFSGREQDLMIDEVEAFSSATLHPEISRSLGTNPVYPSSSDKKASNYFSKAWLYSNSRLPPHLPPFKVYMPTYPLLCLAASYSERVYTPPTAKSQERESHVASDWRSGTKAMVLKSVPIDDMNLIVFAVRGSATFMDWAVNFRQAPSSPDNFLDDAGNLCHAGFLQVARQMIQPVADRLKTLLQENPGRSSCSLLITGHSAGGAVAALLYAHMLSTTVRSDLNYLTGFFKRVHCITFGAPPVSLLPLQKPDAKRHKKSLFYSFINEGDPVPRADKHVVRSLLKLYASPAPTSNSICSNTLASFSNLHISGNPSSSTLQTNVSKSSKMSKFSKNSASTSATASMLPSWTVPPTTLSTAGRLIVLRSRIGGRGTEEEVEAVTVDDELLRSVVFGDPWKHQMVLYKRRIEFLATKAATAKGY
ncbi:Alpha/Beta hydrolase protein [Lophiotrema nucula]|uniref:Alpha/Beta hydrolase protein n=1 Tax=Lophiotrema nucula TaxID=690887 RepID=A0A6A5YLQ1_9PLEO|nr:Alpha/Beta hydrolase protein [Lophiotrema nucula]